MEASAVFLFHLKQLTVSLFALSNPVSQIVIIEWRLPSIELKKITSFEDVEYKNTVDLGWQGSEILREIETHGLVVSTLLKEAIIVALLFPHKK